MMTYGRKILRTSEARSAGRITIIPPVFTYGLLSQGGQLEFDARALPFMRCTHDASLTDSLAFIDRTFGTAWWAH